MKTRTVDLRRIMRAGVCLVGRIVRYLGRFGLACAVFIFLRRFNLP